MPVAEAPTPTPATETSPAPSQNFNDSMSSLSNLFPQSQEMEMDTTKPDAPQEAAKAVQKRPETKEEVKSPPSKPEAPKAKETPPEKPQDKPSEPPVKAKTLKEALDMSKASEKQWRQKYEALQQEASKPRDDSQLKTLAERLEAREKRLAELEQEIKYTAFEKSGEYKEKYERPFLDAFNAGRSKVSNIKVRDGRVLDNDGAVVQEGTWRAGTPADFDALMKIHDDGDAAEYADRVFGNKASIAMYHRERAQELHAATLKAKEDYRSKGSEIEKQRSEMTQAQYREAAQAWESENKAAIEKYPQWFKPEDGDDKGNAILSKGMSLADMMFNGQADQLSPKDRARLHSAIRNKAGGFDRIAYKLSQSTKELKELKEKLKAYEDSEPTGGDQRKQPSEDKDTSFEGVLSTLNKLATPIR